MLQPFPFEELLGLIQKHSRFDYNFESLEPLGEGFSSLVFMAQGLVFRVAKTPEVLTHYHYEAEFLRQVHRKLPLNLPEPVEVIEFQNNPWSGCFVSTFQDGRTPREDELELLNNQRDIQALADFLAALHSQPHMQSLDQDSLKRYEHRLEFCFQTLKKHLTPQDMQTLQKWASALPRRLDCQSEPVVCHGDLWYGNLLLTPFEEGFRLSGVVDFERVRLAHPALDLARLRHVSPKYQSQVIQAYSAHRPLPENLEEQLQLHWELQAFDGIHHCIVLGDQVELLDAIEKLRWQVQLL